MSELSDAANGVTSQIMDQLERMRPVHAPADALGERNGGGRRCGLVITGRLCLDPSIILPFVPVLLLVRFAGLPPQGLDPAVAEGENNYEEQNVHPEQNEGALHRSFREGIRSRIN